MAVILSKVSLPNAWDREFASVTEAARELRRYICGECLSGRASYVGLDEPVETLQVDIEHEGRVYECLDVRTLLSTSCGLEFELTGDHGLWPDDSDQDRDEERDTRRSAKRMRGMSPKASRGRKTA